MAQEFYRKYPSVDASIINAVLESVRRVRCTGKHFSRLFGCRFALHVLGCKYLVLTHAYFSCRSTTTAVLLPASSMTCPKVRKESTQIVVNAHSCVFACVLCHTHPHHNTSQHITTHTHAHITTQALKTKGRLSLIRSCPSLMTTATMTTATMTAAAAAAATSAGLPPRGRVLACPLFGVRSSGPAPPVPHQSSTP